MPLDTANVPPPPEDEKGFAMELRQGGEVVAEFHWRGTYRDQCDLFNIMKQAAFSDGLGVWLCDPYPEKPVKATV